MRKTGDILVPFVLLLTILLTITQKVFAQPQSTLSSAKLASSSEDVEIDRRAYVLEQYLRTKGSPMSQNAKTFVRTADTYGLDYRFLAAISGVESSFGLYLPANSYNGWGWGIYGGNVTRFASYDEAIETISKELKENYIEKWGAANIYEIGSIYAADPSWANKVIRYMNEIERFENVDPISSLPLSL